MTFKLILGTCLVILSTPVLSVYPSDDDDFIFPMSDAEWVPLDEAQPAAEEVNRNENSLGAS